MLGAFTDVDQQNRALEAATITLHYFKALGQSTEKTQEYSIFIFSQNQDSSGQITVMSQK